jgi:hypothetical protein
VHFSYPTLHLLELMPEILCRTHFTVCAHDNVSNIRLIDFFTALLKSAVKNNLEWKC